MKDVIGDKENAQDVREILVPMQERCLAHNQQCWSRRKHTYGLDQKFYESAWTASIKNVKTS